MDNRTETMAGPRTRPGPVRKPERAGRMLLALLLTLFFPTLCTTASEKKTSPEDPYRKTYGDYVPSFIKWMRNPPSGVYKDNFFRKLKRSPEEMELSTEKTFYTLSSVDNDARATALVKAGIEREQAGMYREALKVYERLYRQCVEPSPNVLYRVSEFGVYVPAWQYVQRRILNFPKEDLAYYRTKYDAAARDAFEQARRSGSLIGLSVIADKWSATSYGDNVLYELGRAALDGGDYFEALECFTSLEQRYPASECLTPELRLLVAYCRKMLGGAGGGAPGKAQPTKLSAAQLALLKKTVGTARYEKPPHFRQSHSGAYIGSDDYGPLPQTNDPLALKTPVWSRNLTEKPVRGGLVYTHPVVTNDSVIYRYRNIIYCRSILNGELRWKNDMGGRVKWQNYREVQWPQEDLVVQDGLVFTPMNKIGPSLVALDEITGELKWAYGPIQASTSQQAKMRFLAAPAGGPRTVYAGYVLDNIEGDTHTDTEYGMIAFESTTGRVRWQTPLCRLQPDKFISLHTGGIRNRIRSFTSPPLYHQGTLYYNTNAGVVAALSARTGQVKWLVKYPYYQKMHDAVRPFYKAPVWDDDVLHYWAKTIPWYNQRPLMIGENLYIPIVDSPMLACLDRGTGKVKWHHQKHHGSKGTFSHAYLVGPMSTGELVLAYSGRSQSVQLLDPETGKIKWKSPEFLERDDHPVMKYDPLWIHYRINSQNFYLCAKPFLDTQDRLCFPNYVMIGLWSWRKVPSYCNHHAFLDLRKKKLISRRRHYDDVMLAFADHSIRFDAPATLKKAEADPRKTEKLKKQIKQLKEICADQVPVNDPGPAFAPFNRVTFERYGQPFELRISPKAVSIFYDADRVKQVLAKRQGPAAEFARAELAYMEARYEDAGRGLKNCLSAIPSEDLDFRRVVNQQLFRVHQELARSAIRSGNKEKEFENCLGLSRTMTTLSQEVEALFAVAESHERKGKVALAGECLRQLIDRYGHNQYPIPSVLWSGAEKLTAAADERLTRAKGFAKGLLYEGFVHRCASLSKFGLPLYASSLTPLPRDLRVRVGDLAAMQLVRLQKRHPEFAGYFSKQAEKHLQGRPVEEQFHQLPRFPGAASSRKVLQKLFAEFAARKGPDGRRGLRQLADMARIGGYEVPAEHRQLVKAPPPMAEAMPLALSAKAHQEELKDEAGTQWLVMKRRGDRKTEPHLLFLGGRVRKRLDNKFLFRCMDQRSGKTLWRATEKRGVQWVEELRLKGTGKEPGFFEAFVYGDRVVTCGMYDVLAFGLKDGKLLWRWRVPPNFEIEHAVMSGDLLVVGSDVETMALYIPTDSPVGETAWQVKEQGAVYVAPYFHGDRLVSLRKAPFNLTVRYRTTGRLLGRLDLPDLSLNEDHPIVEGPAERRLPVAHDGKHLVVSDTWYYIMIDVETMTVQWKRLIDSNDVTRDPPLRLALKGDYLAVQKHDYTAKALHVLSSRTGKLLWRTEQEDPNLQPMYSILIDGERMYGLEQHRGVGFRLVCRESKTGKRVFQTTEKGYAGDPEAALKPRLYGSHLVVRVQDRQDFELKVFDREKGKRVHMLKTKGTGIFGVHGRVSETVQNGRLALFGEDVLRY